MTQPLQKMAGILLRKLESIAALREDDLNAVQKLPIQFAKLTADQDIVREGDRPSRTCIILRGMTYWGKLTNAGKRQISSFSVGGDMPDLHSLYLSVMDSSLTTLSPCEIGFVQHEAVRDLCDRNPRVAAAFWKMTLIDGAVFREWVTNVGSRPAYTRMAHLLCEMVVRLKAVGLAENNTCALPITQAQLGEALGLSVVHTNRSLQSLRKDGLIKFKQGRLRIPNWNAMVDAADFDPTYLHLRTDEVQKPQNSLA